MVNKFNYVVKVIRSCKTLDQLYNSKAWVKTLKIRFDKDTWSNEAYYIDLNIEIQMMETYLNKRRYVYQSN